MSLTRRPDPRRPETLDEETVQDLKDLRPVLEELAQADHKVSEYATTLLDVLEEATDGE